MIYHLANTYSFLNDALKALKVLGLIIISEVNIFLALRIFLRIMHHVRWSYNDNVFSPDQVFNKASDPWLTNCFIPKMLFRDVKKCQHKFQNSKIIHKRLTEFFISSLSGGVIVKTKTINSSLLALKLIDFIDKFLIRIIPSFPPLGMKNVIEKKKLIFIFR